MPDIRVIGLSMFTDADIANKMRQAGADGFVSKSESSSQLLKAIYKVAGLNRASSR
jgi:DNA-binding NarL/FixJ family response regulator